MQVTDLNPKTSIRVLLVEDDPGACKLVEHALSDAQSTCGVCFELQTARDLATARTLLQRNRFDNILLDLGLPDSRGADTVRRIREATPETPIVVLTASDDEETGLQAIQRGADYFLIKGTLLRDLLSRCIRYSVERRRADFSASSPPTEQGAAFQKEFESMQLKLAQEQKEKAKLEEQFSKLRREFLTIFDSVPAMIWYLDQNGRIHRVNRSGAETLQISIKELIGRNYEDLFLDEYGCSGKGLKDAFEGHEQRAQLKSYTKASGESGFALVDHIPHRDPSGVVQGVLVFAKDVTDIKRAEKDLQQAKDEIEVTNRQLAAALEQANRMATKAMEADRFKSEFLANVSHEIRTPMNSIIGFSDLLSQENLSDDQKQYISIIQHSCDHLLGLINDVLDFSKIESGNLDVEMIPCSITEILESVDHILRPLAQQKGLQFNIQQDQNLPSSFITDPTRIRQCLINLLNNAIKFTQEGYVRLTARKKKQEILFLVEDTGAGIPEDKHDIIMQPFRQADNSTSRHFGGTGLGLAITNNLAVRLGGSLQFVSTPGQGSIFTLSLPAGTTEKPHRNRVESKKQSKSTYVSSNTKSRNGKVLLVEGHPVNRLLIRSIFNHAHIAVQEIHCVNDDLKNELTDNVDLVIWDGTLLGQKGPALLQRLRDENISTPFVLLLDRDLQNLFPRYSTIEATECLTKPILRRELHELIERHLHQPQA